MKNRKAEASPRETAFLRLLVRTLPLVHARPDIAAAPLPAPPDWSSKWTAPNEPVLVLQNQLAERTLGALARLWTNAPGPDCPDCRRGTVLTGFGGSLVSGNGQFASWFCPGCGNRTITHDKSPSEIINEIKAGSRTDAFLRPEERSWDGRLPAGLRPCALEDVFGGRLAEEYFRLALETLESLDRHAAECALAGRSFSLSIGLKVGEATGSVSFGERDGFAVLRSPVAGRSERPVRYDATFGLMPMLREAASWIAGR